MRALNLLLDLWVENPGIAVVFCAVCLMVAFRFAFLSGLRVTLTQESRAVELERAKEHAARAVELRNAAAHAAEREVA